MPGTILGSIFVYIQPWTFSLNKFSKTGLKKIIYLQITICVIEIFHDKMTQDMN